MEQTNGSYKEAELTDGRMGSYVVAQQYYRDFDRLRIESPEKFNRICHSVLGDSPSSWHEEDKQILGIAGLAFPCAAEGVTKLKVPEAEIRDFIKLAVKPTIVSRMFGMLTSDVPDYDLQSPFADAIAGEPDLVAAVNLKDVPVKFEGERKDNPGFKLVPDPTRKAPERPHPYTNPIVF
jgi:hypothetical protein